MSDNKPRCPHPRTNGGAYASAHDQRVLGARCTSCGEAVDDPTWRVTNHRVARILQATQRMTAAGNTNGVALLSRLDTLVSEKWAYELEKIRLEEKRLKLEMSVNQIEPLIGQLGLSTEALDAYVNGDVSLVFMALNAEPGAETRIGVGRLPPLPPAAPQLSGASFAGVPLPALPSAAPAPLSPSSGYRPPVLAGPVNVAQATPGAVTTAPANPHVAVPPQAQVHVEQRQLPAAPPPPPGGGNIARNVPQKPLVELPDDLDEDTLASMGFR